MEKNKHSIRSRYEFYLDLSGTLKKSNDDIYIGSILMPDLYKSSFREKFYRQFPSLHSFNKKGSSLKPEKLKEIIEYMNADNVKMSCVLVKRHIINQANKSIRNQIHKARNIPLNRVNLRFFEERLIASAYVEALSKYARIGYPYNCLSCMESQFDIQQTFVAIGRISYPIKLHLRFSSIPRRTEHMIKFADFVASAGRKLDRSNFDNLKNFTFTEYAPDLAHFDRAFNISRHSNNNPLVLTEDSESKNRKA